MEKKDGWKDERTDAQTERHNTSSWFIWIHQWKLEYCDINVTDEAASFIAVDEETSQTWFYKETDKIWPGSTIQRQNQKVYHEISV